MVFEAMFRETPSQSQLDTSKELQDFLTIPLEETKEERKPRNGPSEFLAKQERVGQEHFK
jgi:hypothetical protein